MLLHNIGIGKIYVSWSVGLVGIVESAFSLFLYSAHETCDFPRTLAAEARVFFRVFPRCPAERVSERASVRECVREFRSIVRVVSCVDDIFLKRDF